MSLFDCYDSQVIVANLVNLLINVIHAKRSVEFSGKEIKIRKVKVMGFVLGVAGNRVDYSPFMWQAS